MVPFNRNHSGSSCAKEIRKADYTGAKTEKLAENNKLAGTDVAPLAALKVTFGFTCLVFALFEGGQCAVVSSALVATPAPGGLLLKSRSLKRWEAGMTPFGAGSEKCCMVSRGLWKAWAVIASGFARTLADFFPGHS